MDMFLIPEVMYTIFIFSAPVLIILILFLLTVQKALNRCAPENRDMKPGQVWLMLVPVVNIVWQYILVSRTADSLAKEFKRRNIPLYSLPGKSIGLAFCILFTCVIIPGLNILTAPAGLICFIVYWVKISGYSSTLAMPCKPQVVSTNTERSHDISAKEGSGKPDNKSAEPSSSAQTIAGMPGNPEKLKQIAFNQAAKVNSMLDLYEKKQGSYITPKEDLLVINKLLNFASLPKILEGLNPNPDIYAVVLSFMAREYKSLGDKAGDIGYRKEFILLIRKILNTGGIELMEQVNTRIIKVDSEYIKIIQKYLSMV